MFGLTLLTFIIAICFVGYGISCLFTEKMQKEFDRFGLSVQQRKLTGLLQILASLGLVIGYYFYPLIALISAAGLSLQMLLGFLVRLKVKDRFYESAPSLIFMVLNAYVALGYYYIFS